MPETKTSSLQEQAVAEWSSLFGSSPLPAWFEFAGQVVQANEAALRATSSANLTTFVEKLPDSGLGITDSWEVASGAGRCFLATRQTAQVNLERIAQSLSTSDADCVKVLDAEGRLRYMNPGGMALLCIRDFNTVAGSRWVEFWQGEYRAIAENAVESARAGGVGKFVGECPKADGESAWWDVVVTPIHDAAGVVGGFLSVSREVTALKRIQTLERLEREILEAAAANQPPSQVLAAICQLVKFLTEGRADCAILSDDSESSGTLLVVAAPTVANLQAVRSISRAALSGYDNVLIEPLKDSEGNSLGALTLWLDRPASGVSDKKLLEKAGVAVNLATVVLTREAHVRRLRQKQERLVVLDRAAPVALYQTGSSGRWIYTNSRYTDFTGLSHEQSSGEGWLDAVHPEDRENVRAEWLDSRSAGRDFRAAFRLVHGIEPHQPPRWVMAHESRVESIGFIGAMADITETEEARQRLSTLANNISQLCWMADSTGWIFWYNDRWYDYTGTTLEQMQGWGWREIHHPDHVDRVVEKISRCWTSGEDWEDTFPLRGKDGEYRWFLSRAVPIRDAQGRILRWFGTNTDVTELRELEGALARQNAALRQSNEELSRFAYVVSHDLQEPVRMMSNYAQLVRRSSADVLSEKALGHLEAISNSATRMSHLIRDILYFAHAAAGDQEALLPVPLEDSLNAVRGALNSLIDETQAEISVQPGGLPVVLASPVLAQQLLQNLISNSIKYRRAETPPSIHLTAHRIGGMWKITVEDNGQGFDNKDASRMFGFMQRLHGRETPGSGIGLSICKSIVERSGGSMGACGELGRGAKIWFTLPAAGDRQVASSKAL